MQLEAGLLSWEEGGMKVRERFSHTPPHLGVTYQDLSGEWGSWVQSMNMQAAPYPLPSHSVP